MENKYVILLCGGSASGKTEFANSNLYKEKAFVFDTTLSTSIGAEIKIKKCLKYNKIVIIYFIIPNNLKRCFNAFVGRERQFNSKYFLITHSGCRSTLLYIHNKYPNIEIRIIKSYYKKSTKIHFQEQRILRRDELKEYINNIQLDIYKIKSIIQ